MIIKFDHITYVTDEEQYASVHNKMELNGYKLKFKEINLRNIQPKMTFLLSENANHSMYYYEAEIGLPIEVIVYKKLREGFPTIDYSFKEAAFSLKTNSVDVTAALLRSLGAQMSDDTSWKLSGFFDKTPIYSFLKEENKILPFLDTEGFCCPTLLVDSYERVKKVIEEDGGTCTKMEELSVNGRVLKVFFAIAGNTIIELISSK